MLLIHAYNIIKYYGDRKIIEFEEFKLFDNDKIGIVGINGAGKTTFLNILTGKTAPDSGTVKRYSGFSYITQFGDIRPVKKSKITSQMGVIGLDSEKISGGEITRKKIAAALESEKALVLADEPTSNLDYKGIRCFEKNLIAHKGALLLITHDRELIDRVCKSIIEIENGNIKKYPGNYSDYIRQKEAEGKRSLFEYEQYIKEKKKLENTLVERKQKIGRIKKTPKRMGNSEARLHKSSSGEIKKKLSKNVNAIQTRLEKLEKKEKPYEVPGIKMDANSPEKIISKTALRVNSITAGFGERILFRESSFSLPTGSKTALLGDNGTGKTTLLGKIWAKEKGISVSNGVKIGYFSQDFEVLEYGKSILENVMKESIQPEWIVRTVLARLLLKEDHIYRKAAVISGGEKVKTSLAKLIVSEANLLLLDEPTNYLDIYSMEALQQLVKKFPGTVLFISHDRKFVKEIADRLLILEDKKISTFEGGYTGYVESKKSNASENEKKNEIMKLKMKMADLAAKISITGSKEEIEFLDKEYKNTAALLRELTLKYKSNE